MNKKQILITIILVSILCGASYYVGANSYIGNTPEIWINPPFSEASYVVGQYNSTYYYAKNSTTGKFDYLSTNASYVLQSTFGHNRTIFIKAGRYTINYDVKCVYTRMAIVGEDGAVLVLGANGGITFTRPSGITFVYDCKVLGLSFDGQNVAQYGIRSRSTEAGNIIFHNSEIGWCRFTQFDNATAKPIDLVGVEHGTIHDCIIGACYTAVYLWEDGTYEAGNLAVEHNYIYIPHSNSIGVLINCSSNDADSGVGAITVQNNHFLGDDNGAYAVVIDATLAQETCGHNKILRNRCESVNLVKTISPTYLIKYTEIKDNDVKSGSGTLIDLCSATTVSEISDNILYASGSAYFIKDAFESSTVTEINRFYNNRLYGSGLVSFTAYSYVADNLNLNPLGVSVNYRVDSTFSYYGTYGNWGNNSLYRVRTTDMVLYVTGGSGLNITLYDKNGVQTTTNLTGGIYQITWYCKLRISYVTQPSIIFEWK